MPVINPLLVPTITPGSLFSALTSDNTLNVRWLNSADPVFYGALNRPLADIVLRQLILAKAIDNLNASLGHEVLFPFLIQPKIISGSGDLDVPITWLWDIQLSLPKKWEYIRLAKIKRISGTNTGSYTGKLRLVFTATQQGSSIETAIVYADYTIDSTLTYQIVRVTAVTTAEEAVAISPSEQATVTGFVVFKTLDVTDTTIQTFLNTVEPPASPVVGSDGDFSNPAVYQLIDASPTDPSGHYSSTSVSHGTGLLEPSAWAPIPALDSDVQSWIDSFNYPFDADANRTSTAGIIIPLGLFREFDIAAPAGDEPTSDISGDFYPVWINRIERVDSTSDHLRFFFATYNVTDTATGGAPSTEPIEFATLDLTSNMTPGQIVEIVSINNLQLREGTDSALWNQHFGRGHVVLSNIWGATTTDVSDFFASFASITDSPADTAFSKTATRISSFGLSRVPKYIPTIGQAQALLGSTSRLSAPLHPSFDNRYVTEKDQGQGNQIDLEAQAGITPDLAIERYGYSGSLCHRIVKLVIDSTQVPTGNNTFYNDKVLPRLRILLGRDPVFGDEWFNGVRFVKFNGDTWEG